MSSYMEFRLWIIAIHGGLSVLLLAAIWHYYYFKRRKPQDRPDYGLLFLCAGLTVWVFSAIIGLSTPLPLQAGIIHSLSMINNGLIACSFPFFEYSVIADNKKTVRKHWTAITLGITVLILMLICFVDAVGYVLAGNILNFSSTAVILLILTGILYKTFDKRKLKPLGYFSILVMVAMLMSQFFLAFKDEVLLQCSTPALLNLGAVMGGISFSMFILILVALAFTWIMDRSDVFEEWRDEEEAHAYWNKYNNQYNNGIKDLTKELAYKGLSGAFFQKLFLFFEIYVPGDNQFNDMKNMAVQYSGRYYLNQKQRHAGTVEHEKLTVDINVLYDSVIELLRSIDTYLQSSQKNTTAQTNEPSENMKQDQTEGNGKDDNRKEGSE